MTSSNKKNLVFGAVTALLLLLAFEALCYVAYRVNPLSVFGWQYYDDAFVGLKPARGGVGWDAYGDEPRPSLRQFDQACASAFGDSFTHGDEVTHDEAWARIASDLLGCEIVNHGVGGFGTDQAYIRFQKTDPQTPVILLGVYQEMLRRNLSASWLFYGMQRGSTLKPYFTLSDAGLTEVPMPSELSVDSLKRYHDADRYYDVVRMKPPYSLALLRAVYYRAFRSELDKLRMLPPEKAYEDRHAFDLQMALVDRLRADAAKRAQRLSLVFFPTADQAERGIFPYKTLLDAMAAAHPDVCLIDPGPALHHASVQAGKPLAAPIGHFDAQGNRVIAEVVARRLRECGLIKQH